ncbi:MAG: hypothetical protein LBN26_10135 [Christensenellaceae bacterium]|jgi:phosphate starvation-inducible membrane PsiE|nr:hypothetical protein [Christensenellaceae bacterium]
MEETTTLQNIMLFVQTNIAYILLGAAVLYFIWFISSIVKAHKTGERFRFKFGTFFAFLLILGVAVYCFVTGTDLSTFIN